MPAFPAVQNTTVILEVRDMIQRNDYIAIHVAKTLKERKRVKCKPLSIYLILYPITTEMNMHTCIQIIQHVFLKAWKNTEKDWVTLGQSDHPNSVCTCVNQISE